MKEAVISINIFVSQLLQRHPSPSEVVQWSNHRVMEWLRAVDLAEYAPNLRGSGVHGGLIVSTIHLEFVCKFFKSYWHYMLVLHAMRHAICCQYVPT